MVEHQPSWTQATARSQVLETDKIYFWPSWSVSDFQFMKPSMQLAQKTLDGLKCSKLGAPLTR